MVRWQHPLCWKLSTQKVTGPAAGCFAGMQLHKLPKPLVGARPLPATVVRITNPLDHVTHEVELKIHSGELLSERNGHGFIS